MNRKRKTAVIAMAVLVMMTQACSLPLVARSELDEQVAKVAELQSKLDKANADLAETKRDLEGARGELKGVQGRLDDVSAQNRKLVVSLEALKPLVCSKHSWDEGSKAGFWSLDVYYDKKDFVVVENEWGIRVEFTQWKPYPSAWVKGDRSSALVWDKFGGVVYDAADHCVILDPRLWRNAGSSN